MTHKLWLGALAGLCLSACAEDTTPADAEVVDAGEIETGDSEERIEKGETSLDAVPAEVIALAQSANPGGTLTAAEYEVKNGREIYDIGGVTADGSEVEFDIGREPGGEWAILETQKDIAPEALPPLVTAELARSHPDFTVNRVIEGDLPDGTTVYEIYGTDADGAQMQIEILVENGEARTLEELLPY
ncbi:hypothetical protein FF098_000785 [Parvularcula flava]|uniref:PepSY domain-containing protein n=1 Tax=Aquisalinus luteolus TaxID=1566827 RepID=A0A8J3ENX9_9PROT|nr:PepSY domain-containing protein [Aquisalinus luteolus]NHK26437.1 hypothetical protein [Aquisalinus luteolus]GGH92331.1 hypothetical protein GCM10011355_01580 [Aquisalinus luteolus]